MWFLTDCIDIIWYYRSLLCYGKFLEKLGKNKNKLRGIIYPKIIKILRAASLGSNFTGSYKKECNAN